MKATSIKFALVLVIMALLLAGCGKVKVPVFADVPQNGAFYSSIQTVAKSGYMIGTGKDPVTFSPDDPLTRVQAAVLVLRLKNGPSWNPPAATGTVFADMDASHWGAAWAEQAYSEGLVYGCGSKNHKPTFCPDDPMVFTRELVAFFIAADLK